MAGYKFGAIGMAGGIIGLAAIAAWLGLAHTCDPQGGEAVIAFRGTDKDDLGDWISNFRWLYRLVPKFDQYAQVQTHITNIVRQIKKHGCSGPGTQIVTAGHSLGGGLAQQAAYADADADIHF